MNFNRFSHIFEQFDCNKNPLCQNTLNLWGIRLFRMD